jgi:transposase InsO family protein
MESYYDVREPGSYGGVNALYRLMKLKGRRVTEKQVREWLTTQEAYGLHKPARRRFPRRKIYSRGPHYLWQADLADLNQLTSDNDGYRYLLTVIDVFTKYAYAVPLKKKDGQSVTRAFETIFAINKPLKLSSDKGKEFLNTHLQTLLKDKGIQFYTSNDDNVKASVVERFNRTLKTKMFKYLTHNNTHRFIDVLPDLMHSYNNTYHRTIGMAPAQVNAANAADVYARMYGSSEMEKKEEAKLRVGDIVRLSNSRQIFVKSYLPSWTMELFKISEVIKTQPPTYKIVDFKDEPIIGSFYESELQKVVKLDNVYKVEKVLRTRGRKGQREMYVKYLGWPEKFNEWVREQDISDII